MKNNPLRFGILGCASIARRMFAPALVEVPEAKLVAVAARDVSRAKQFAHDFACDAENSYESLLAREDIDAVYLPLPPALHETWTLRALAAGKHVLCEKPLSTSLDSSQNMVAAAKRAGRVLEENWMFLHHAQLRQIENILASGQLGELRLLRATFGFPPLPPDNFRYNADLGGGALTDAGGYTFRIARRLLGDPLKILGSHLQTPKLGTVDHFGGALLVSRNEVSAQVAFGFNSHYQCELELWSENAKLTAPRIFTAPPGFSPIIRIEHGNGIDEIIVPPDNHFANAIRCFVHKIADNTLDYSDLLQQAGLTEAIRTHANHSCYQALTSST